MACFTQTMSDHVAKYLRHYLRGKDTQQSAIDHSVSGVIALNPPI